MGLPSEERPPGEANGTSYHDQQSVPTAHAALDTQPNLPRQYSNTETSVQAPEGREGGSGEPTPEANARDRPRGSGRRPSTHRICGKCQRHLTGQFVRALGDTYHLECFTCHVRITLLSRSVSHWLTRRRTVTRS